MAINFDQRADTLFDQHTQATATTPLTGGATRPAMPSLLDHSDSLKGLNGIVELDAAGRATGHEAVRFTTPIKDQHTQFTAQKKAVEKLHADAKAATDASTNGTTFAADEAKVLTYTTTAETHAGHVVNAVEDAKVHASNFEAELQATKDAVLKKGVATGNVPKAQAIVEHLEEEAVKHRGFITKTEGMITKVEGEIKGLLPEMKGVASAAPVAGAVAAATGAVEKGAKIIVGQTAAKNLGIDKAVFEKKGFVGKYLAGARANLNVSSIDKAGKVTTTGTVGKITKVGVAGLGAVIGGYGLKDLGQVAGIVGPDMDEQGKEVPVDSSKLFKAAAELGIGATAIYLTLIKGGHNKAMGVMTK